MGRPVKKDVKGTVVFGTSNGNVIGIRCEAYIVDAYYSDCYLEKQKGSRSYKVISEGSDVQGHCKLVSEVPDEHGQVRVVGYVNSDLQDAKPIAKLQKRTAIDFDGNRYRWHLENDSTTDYIVLEPIA